MKLVVIGRTTKEKRVNYVYLQFFFWALPAGIELSFDLSKYV